jgi:hypothetical protein
MNDSGFELDWCHGNNSKNMHLLKQFCSSSSNYYYYYRFNYYYYYYYYYCCCCCFEAGFVAEIKVP